MKSKKWIIPVILREDLLEEFDEPVTAEEAIRLTEENGSTGKLVESEQIYGEPYQPDN